MKLLTPAVDVTAPFAANPLLPDPVTALALALGLATGAIIGAVAATFLASIRRRSKTGAVAEFLTTIHPVGLDHASEGTRALEVLQAEHDRVRSEMAQRAGQIARLEAELRTMETNANRERDELTARIESEMAGREAALGEVTRLRNELTRVQSIAAEVSGPPG
ncbi:MAG: hypothetical protein SH859_04190 [Hyphomicrobium aestuarii]|nr:hypothetical protein [Hyphomicrobium aestuarii]